MKKQLDLNYIKYFYYVVKENGFTKAAEKLNVQQPVVSRAVKLLEAEFNTALLERQRKGIILTNTGKEVFNYCRELFEVADRLQDYVNERLSIIQKITIACSDSLSLGIIETIFSVMRKSYPELKIIHFTGNASAYIDDIQSGKIDMGFFFNLPPLPVTLEKTKLLDVDFHYVIKSNLKNNKDILNSYIATTSQTFHAPEYLPLFKKYQHFNKKAEVSFVSNSSMTRKASVMKGVGVSILPDFMIRDELAKGQLTSLHRPEKLSLYLIERSSSYRSKLKNQIIAEITKIAGQ